MITVEIDDTYAEVLAAFGNLETELDLALRRYAIEQITAKIAQLRERDAVYRTKYSTDYPTFAQRIALDADFVQQIESSITPLWEIDLADWEFCFEGIADWTSTLQSILLAS